MAEPLASNLAFSFAPEGGSLNLENWNGFVGMGSVALALTDTMPPGRVSLFASVGEVSDFNMDGSRPVPASFVMVNGEAYATVPPGADFEIVFSLDSAGQEIPKPTVRSRHKDKVFFNKRFWGMLRVANHTVSFKVLKYTPQKVGGLWTYGQVAAFKMGVMATVEVAAAVAGTGNDEIEIYRIESESLINSEGEWEKPLGWPDNPSYANNAKPPRAKVGVISTRVHEIGMVTSTGYFYTRTYHITNQKPYFGDETYVPKKNLVHGKGMSSLPEALKIKAMEIITARGKGQYL